MFFGLALSFRKRVNKFAYTDTILMYTFAKRSPFSSIAFILIPGRGVDSGFGFRLLER